MVNNRSPGKRQKPIAIYARISKDRAGRAEGVKEQERLGREYVKETWGPRVPVAVFADNDLSAADENVYRPAFEELRQAIRRGEIGGLWSVEQSRLTRREIEWFGFVADLVSAGIEEVHTRRNGVVQAGAAMAGINAVLSADEARNIKKRTKDKHLALASEGRPGGSAGFGYRNAKDKDGRATLVIHKAEAKVVREIARRIIRGDSLSSIADDLRRRKVPTTRGGNWRYNTITSVVTKPMVAGLRQHNGGSLVKAIWEPILDRKTWERVRTILGQQEREAISSNGSGYLVNNRRRIYQRHFLTGGIAVCGRCGTPLVVQTGRARTDRPGHMMRESYVCPRPRGSLESCGRLAIPKDDLDQWITELVQFSFLGSDVDEALAQREDDPRTPLLDEIGRLQRELDQFDKMRGENRISDRRWWNVTQGLEAQLKAAKARLRTLPTEGVEVGTSSAAIVDGWPSYTLAQKRRVVQLLWREIAVLPAREAVPGRKPGSHATVPNPEVESRPRRSIPGLSPRFDPRRLRFVSAGDEGMEIDDSVIAALVEALSE